MGMHDWAAVCSVELIQHDGYKDTLRVHCYWNVMDGDIICHQSMVMFINQEKVKDV